MRKQYRVLEVKASGVIAQSLDEVRTERISLVSPRKYIENELLVLSETHDAKGRRRVLGSHIDPSYIADSRPSLVPRGGLDYEFDDIHDRSEAESFHEVLDSLERGDRRVAGQRCREFLVKFPLHIDSYYHLGLMATESGRSTLASKYFEMGYRIGLRALPTQFEGQLPWQWAGNRPFLRAAHSYALSLEKAKRMLDASDIYESLLRWDPDDRRGIRHSLPSFYLRARAISKAESALHRHGTDGVNQFTKSLIEIERGRLDEALRWFCFGAAYNPYLPDLLLGEFGVRVQVDEDRVGRAGGMDEASLYAHEMGRWWRKEKPWDFLINLVRNGPLRTRLDRAVELRNALEQEPYQDSRIEVVVQLGELFGQDSIPEILDECRGQW